MSGEELEVARAHWRLDQHDDRLSGGAKTFDAMTKGIAGVRDEVAGLEKKALLWLASSALVVLGAAAVVIWGASQRSEQAVATGKGLIETRAAVSDLNAKVSDLGKTLDHTAQAFEYLGQHVKDQDAEIKQLRADATRRRP